ncbi:MAG: hypothetical protein A3K19_14080 [Lentisphaerae bacterium RIFOXYB12_FULL_65_16]|nr:MAG: hypothetical protein A3K18_16405 [Lentisphaerae bacterium RIFOXYA12_64_32]OGV89096.1 MAG: hypothetical protein A3K19_14080 [Lentisphaerae bacterium RIFOXYB12_FULL_65_16]
MKNRTAAWLLGLALLPVGRVAGEGAASTGDAFDLSVPYVACGRTTAAPVIDGRLDDACWAGAIEMAPFVLLQGAGFPREQTRTYVLHDGTNLYVGIECDEALLDERLQRTHEIKSSAKTRDGDVWADDSVELFIQPDRRGEAYYHLVINGLGTVYDARCEKGSFDKAWNANIRVAVSADQKSWKVELAVPGADFATSMKDGSTIGFNICRNESPNSEKSCWSPTGAGFHVPATFGVLRLGGQTVGWHGAGVPDFAEGGHALVGALRNSGTTEASASMTVLAKYEKGDWNSVTEHISLPAGAATPVKMIYTLGGPNECFFLDAPAEKIPDTQCFRTDQVEIRGDTEYVVSAWVRAENLAGGGSRPLAFSVSSYDATGKTISSYVPAVAIPTGTYDWKRIEGVWHSPAGAVKALFWMVKWGGANVTGKAWVDDIRFCRRGSVVNVVPNGAVQKDEYGALAGWPVALPVVDGYVRSSQVTVAFQVADGDAAVLYSSAPLAGEVEKRQTIISSSLTLLSCMGDSSDMYRLRTLYAAQGGYLYLPVVLRSAVREQLAGCRLCLEVPAFLSLIDPLPRARMVATERTERDGGACVRYVLAYEPRDVSPAEAKKEGTSVNHLLFRCGAAPEGRSEWKVFFHGEAGDAKEAENETPLIVLPTLQWKRPARVLINDWACSSFYRPFRQLSEAERDLVMQTWRLTGFTQVGMPLGTEPAAKYGFALQANIPLINSPGSLFPKGREYLAAHPEARAVDFSGRKYDNCFCPTYFLSSENAHRADMAAWLEEKAKGLAVIDWDYEVPVTRESSICVCERCITAFHARAGLPAEEQLTPQSILEKHRKEWVDFRCWQNAEIAGSFRGPIKQGNPDVVFSVYSGYQGPTDEQYGIDWRYVSKYCDLVWCGYGRPAENIAATHTAIAGRPFIGGELAWYGSGPYDCAGCKTALFRRLTDCGSGIMVYFNWIVDGRFYDAVSAVASVAADFEPFFLWDKDEKGFFQSRYRRDDSLVAVGGEGKKEDVTVLVRGKERLVFVFNETAQGPRRVDIEHLAWENGMACVDYDSKAVHGATLSFEVPARDVRILHVLVPDGADTIEAPTLMSLEEQQRLACFPLLAWQGRGTRPGDQAYTLEISADKDFPTGGTQAFPDLPGTAHLLRQPPVPGKACFWRVKARDVVTGREGTFSEPAPLEPPLCTNLRAGPEVFSPSGDGILETFALDAELTAAAPWTVAFSDTAGATVRTLAGSGAVVHIEWDGRDEAGKVVPEGEYRYALTSALCPQRPITGPVGVNMKEGIPNPSFAMCRGFVLTVPAGNVSMDKDYRVARGDTYSLRMRTGPAKSSAYWSNYGSGAVDAVGRIPVVPGRKYTFSAWLKASLAQGNGLISLTFFTNDGHWAGVPGKNASGVPCEPVTGETDWVKREITLVAPPNADSAVLFFQVKDAIGTCWFDAAEFKEVE